MDTIANTDVLQFATVAELMQRLSQMGVTQAHLERTLAHPGFTREVSDALQAPVPVVPKRLRQVKREEFILNLFPASFDDNGRCNSNATFPLYGDERKWLTQTPQVRHLLSRLTRQQLVVILERSGLDGRQVKSAEDLGAVLCLSANQVNRIRGRARRVMRDEAIRVSEQGRRLGHFSLGLRPITCSG